MTDAATELDALLSNGPKTYGKCRICGNPRTTQVQARIARLGKNGMIAKGQTRSVSATLCDVHGLELFQAFAERLR